MRRLLALDRMGKREVGIAAVDEHRHDRGGQSGLSALEVDEPVPERREARCPGALPAGGFQGADESVLLGEYDHAQGAQFFPAQVFCAGRQGGADLFGGLPLEDFRRRGRRLAGEILLQLPAHVHAGRCQGTGNGDGQQPGANAPGNS